MYSIATTTQTKLRLNCCGHLACFIELEDTVLTSLIFHMIITDKSEENNSQVDGHRLFNKIKYRVLSLMANLSLFVAIKWCVIPLTLKSSEQSNYSMNDMRSQVPVPFFVGLKESLSLLVSDNAEKYRLRSRILIESESGVTITERHKSTTQTQNGSS